MAVGSRPPVALTTVRAVSRLVVVLVSLLVGTVACTRVVPGTPERATVGVGASDRGYGFAEDRCGLLLDGTVQEIVGAKDVVRAYSGAVCQYLLRRGPAVTDVTFFWFESGTLERERSVASQRNAQITDVVVQRHDGFLARSGSGCAATAATNPGVASWWVQFRGEAGSDPCATAQKLLDKTLSADL